MVKTFFPSTAGWVETRYINFLLSSRGKSKKILIELRKVSVIYKLLRPFAILLVVEIIKYR